MFKCIKEHFYINSDNQGKINKKETVDKRETTTMKRKMEERISKNSNSNTKEQIQMVKDKFDIIKNSLNKNKYTRLLDPIKKAATTIESKVEIDLPKEKKKQKKEKLILFYLLQIRKQLPYQ